MGTVYTRDRAQHNLSTQEGTRALPNSQEGQVVLRVNVPNCGFGLDRQLVNEAGILDCGRVVEGRSNWDPWNGNTGWKGRV